MQQNRAPFFIIIGLAVLIVTGLIAGSFFIFGADGDAAPLRRQVEIQVVVAPRLRPWAEPAARRFSQQQPGTTITLVEATAPVPASQLRGPASAAWIAEAGFEVEMARSQGIQISEAQSVASSPLAWGGYTPKVEAFGQLDWTSFNQRATRSPGAKLVIAAPWNTAEGIAALASAVVAHQQNKTALTGSDVGQADSWLTETLGNTNANVRPTPAQDFAGPLGQTLGDAGILAMVSWRSAKLDQNPNFTLIPVEPAIALDYPFVVLAGSQVTPERQAAAQAFQEFLLTEEQQAALANFGLDRAAPSPVQIDSSAADRLLRWAERELR
jgi:hypothetical protein